MDQKLKGYFWILFFILVATGLMSVLVLVLRLMNYPEKGYDWLSPLISLVVVGVCLALLFPTYKKIKEIATFDDEN